MHLHLYCLPFAGGSSYGYKGLELAATKHGIKVLPLELPGRGRRINEKLLNSIEEMAEDTLSQLIINLKDPYAIFGHSMGTLIGYVLTKKILMKGLTPPVHLFFSGSGGPSVPNAHSKLHLKSKADFLAGIREFGGSPAEVLENPELMLFFEPILRADFRATETFAYYPSEPFNIPITCMIGLSEQTTHMEALAWRKETVAGLDILDFPGNHFFIFDHFQQIADIINRKLQQTI